ncbi:MAG: C1 family peptidase [Sphaerochaetaceae bacterium]|nr:C1 family peptidase [Sphaerochaetaceae bacterium]MDD3163789.1 C1 family peptidase [Sphaerochaetaceae bacterium]MDD4006680.1 C1 family peptidase [Sphaerochaetaceae bacterium]MDD4396634.1 C1 family peptidase [Sphaerochaetaceae bacterium]
MNKGISSEDLDKFEKSFDSSQSAQVAMNAAVNNGILDSCVDAAEVRRMQHSFSIQIEAGDICNQKQSGRCWMFAALNVMRLQIMKKLNLKTFELSQSYPLFWDKLEKSNWFLENILKTLDESTDSRTIAFLLSNPIGDGGQWDMFCSLVEKYGVVPKSAMPESKASSATRELDKFITLKLREFACTLRQAHDDGKSISALMEMKDGMMSTIYRMLCISLGKPPRVFDFAARSKDDKFTGDRGITPQQFYKKYVGMPLSDYVSIINATTADKPFGKTFTVKYLGNVEGGRQVKYLNLPAAVLKALAIAQLKDGEAVWFGSDVGQFSRRQEGIMSVPVVAADKLFGTDFPMTKAQRLDYGESLMTHAMVLTGVNLDDSETPDRWRVENSWGEDVGEKGFFVMSDDWFTEYTYQVVINKKYLSKEQLAMFAQDPIELAPWDPMGSLA